MKAFAVNTTPSVKHGPRHVSPVMLPIQPESLSGSAGSGYLRQSNILAVLLQYICEIFKEILFSPCLHVLPTDKTGFYLFAKGNTTVQGAENFPAPLNTPS